MRSVRHLAAPSLLAALLLVTAPPVPTAEAAPGPIPAEEGSGSTVTPNAPAEAGPAGPVLRVAQLQAALEREAPTLDRGVLARALAAHSCAVAAGEAERGEILTVIDYSLPSTAKRLWTFDVAERELLFHELVAHGKNTGGNLATKFSNTNGSKQSSLGLFRTADTYYGKNGYSLRLHGLEDGVNHLALPRLIVIHGAWYVSDDFVAEQGRLGRSWGCPAVREEVARPLIDTIKDGSLVFSYYPDEDWLGGSRFLACGGAGDGARVAATAR